MGLIGFLITVIAAAAGGWWLKAKVDKKPEYHSESSRHDPDEDF